jgi:hypothetical protein
MLSLVMAVALAPGRASAQSVPEGPKAPPRPILPPPATYVPRNPAITGGGPGLAIDAPVLTTGALVFGADYGAAVIAARSSDHAGAHWLYVPVVGPWLALGDWGTCRSSAPRCEHAMTGEALLAADGVVQAASLITMLDGLLDPGDQHRTIMRTAEHFTPTSNGIAAIGTF